MPIYAYKCESCGHAKDVLQKISDQPLSQCPACGASSFVKQLTAAGFQLKGSGWYATDFKGAGSSSSANSTADGGAASQSAAGDSSPASTPAASADSTSASASGGCGASCACH